MRLGLRVFIETRERRDGFFVILGFQDIGRRAFFRPDTQLRKIILIRVCRSDKSRSGPFLAPVLRGSGDRWQVVTAIATGAAATADQ
jgi:hypothetical protein